MTAALTGKALAPKDLLNYQGPLYVENLSHSKIFHSDLQNPGIELELGPVTSETRFSSLPIEVAKHPTFQKIWRRGQVRVSSDPEMEEVLTLSDARLMKAEADRLSSVEASIDTTQQDRSLVQVQCLECKKDTYLTSLELTEGAAPLCLDHKHLGTTWIQEESFDEAKGEIKTSWTKIQVMKTQPGLTQE